MWIYISVVFFTFLSFLYFYKRPNILAYNIIFIVVILIICFGYMCGSDWRTYEEIYNSYSVSNGAGFWWRFLYMEPLYLCLNIIGNELHLNFWFFYICIKVLIFVKIVDVFRRFCPSNLILLAFTFFLGFWGIRNFIDPSFRNMIAVYVFLCGINWLINRNLKRYILLVVIASLFHYSAIILLLFYFILHREYSTKCIIILFLCANIFLLDSDVIFKLISFLFSSIPTIALKIESYTEGEGIRFAQGKIFSLGYLVHIIFFIIILYSRKRIEKLENGKFLFNVSVLFIFIFRMGLTILVFSRFQLYIICFYSIVVAYLIYSFANKYKLMYISFVFLVSLYAVSSQMANIYYVPYTNILFYLDSDVSFEERDRFNLENSPYEMKIEE